MGKIIGIDLGTTKICVSVIENNIPIIIPNAEGGRTTASIVAFTRNGGLEVGESAKKQAILNPEFTIRNIKRFIGKKFTDVSNEINNNSYKVERIENDNIGINIQGRIYLPQEICALILQKIKSDAEEYLGHKITDAIITVPAYFDEVERAATKEAAEIAGLSAIRIISEPTAAALAYGFKSKEDKKIAVFDLGGGTFDISILELGDGVYEVKSTNGNTHLGGNDFDKVIMDWLAFEFNKEQGVDLRKNPTAWQRLKESAENAKIALTTSHETLIDLPYIFLENNTYKHLNKCLTKTKFEELSDVIFKDCIKICEIALKDSGFSKSSIDEIIMVGESCRIPKVLQIVEDFFGKRPNFKVNLMEAVAIGAAIQGGIMDGSIKDMMLLLDVIPLSLGIETYGGVTTVLIKKNETIPTKISETFSTVEDNQSSVEINVLQGERSMAKDNKSICRFKLDGITSAHKGVPQIEVTFDIDANGILSITAKDKSTDRSQSVRVQSGKLKGNEIERLKIISQNHELDRQNKIQRIDKINRIDSFIFSVEKN